MSPKEQFLLIVERINSDLQKKKEPCYKKLRMNSGKFTNIKSIMYYKVRSGSSWYDFLDDHLEKTIHRNIFEERHVDLLGFIYNDTDLLVAIGSGMTWHYITRYCDFDFPLNVAKRIFNPELKAAKAREVSGIHLETIHRYRRDYSPSAWEGIGKVWSNFVGSTNLQALREHEEFENIPEMIKSWSGEIKTSFVIKKSLSLTNVIKLADILVEVCRKPLDDDKEKQWNQWDTMKLIKDDGVKSLLLEELFLNIFDGLKERSNLDYDFCYPIDSSVYFESNKFWIEGLNKISWAAPPSAKDVLIKLPEKSVSSLDELKKTLLGTSFCFRSDGPQTVKRAALYRFIHGEVIYNQKTFIFIDGNWYEFRNHLLKEIEFNFINDVLDSELIVNHINFVPWSKGITKGVGKHDEERYNDYQTKISRQYFGDMIFVQDRMGKIELFDLLHVLDDSVYIIQVKNGFGVSVRDACSQIRLSAELIEKSLKTDDVDTLRNYHGRWQNNKHNNLRFNEFLDLFKTKTRVYMLAFAHKSTFEKCNSQSFQSFIARFEILNLVQAFAEKQWKIGFSNIPIN